VSGPHPQTASRPQVMIPGLDEMSAKDMGAMVSTGTVGTGRQRGCPTARRSAAPILLRRPKAFFPDFGFCRMQRPGRSAAKRCAPGSVRTTAGSLRCKSAALQALFGFVKSVFRATAETLRTQRLAAVVDFFPQVGTWMAYNSGFIFPADKHPRNQKLSWA
jgi:hypothetical protein